MTSTERTSLLREYYTGSTLFSSQNSQVYDLINLIRTDLTVCSSHSLPPPSHHDRNFIRILLVRALLIYVRILRKSSWADHPLSEEQLRGSLVLNTIIKPLENDYVDKSPAIIYSLLVNRLYFIRIQSSALSFHSINATRASLCEILAIRVLDRLHNPHSPTPDDTLLSLANTLVRCFSPFQGAPPDIIPHKLASDQPLKGQTSALESTLFQLC